jgi:cytochrome c oxidase cbb3-type subunit 3
MSDASRDHDPTERGDSAPDSDSDNGKKGGAVHVYDGIEEHDNQLPNWWLWTFGGSILFAFAYIYVYHQGGFLDLPRVAHDKDEQDRAAEEAKRTGVVSSASLLALSRDGNKVSEGKQAFEQNCAVCHRADGGGNIGPNLTDKFWLHGGAPDKVFATINKGVPDKGMAAWGPQLGSDRVQAVTAYVLTMRNGNVAGGKSPQGDAEE